MNLFDLHCDTALEIYRRKESIYNNSCHVSLEKADNIDKYYQVMAIWGDRSLSDEECFSEFVSARSYLENELKSHNLPFYPSTGETDKRRFYLSVEDARLLCGDISRLDYLYNSDVRLIIPVWGGSSHIGGAFDTDEGLTEFGKDVVKRSFELGIASDVSHSSLKTARDIFNIAEKYGKPIIASHSCSFSVCAHPRNLNDDQFKIIKELGGIVGLSFCRKHLDPDGNCDIYTIIKHLDHYLELGGEDMVCMGADMDGTDLPDGISGIGSAEYIYEHLDKEFGSLLADKITFNNAYNFFNKYIER